MPACRRAWDQTWWYIQEIPSSNYPEDAESVATYEVELYHGDLLLLFRISLLLNRRGMLNLVALL